MSFLKEFREFAMRGNVVDLAVGVIIGAAFGKIVSSLVADIIMPPLGLLIGGIDFKQFAVTLRDAQGDVPAVVMHYGVFIQNVFDFIIVAFAIFMAIKLMNKLNRKKEEAPAALTSSPATRARTVKVPCLLSAVSKWVISSSWGRSTPRR